MIFVWGCLVLKIFTSKVLYFWSKKRQIYSWVTFNLGSFKPHLQGRQISVLCNGLGLRQKKHRWEQQLLDFHEYCECFCPARDKSTRFRQEMARLWKAQSFCSLQISAQSCHPGVLTRHMGEMVRHWQLQVCHRQIKSLTLLSILTMWDVFHRELVPEARKYFSTRLLPCNRPRPMNRTMNCRKKFIFQPQGTSVRHSSCGWLSFLQVALWKSCNSMSTITAPSYLLPHHMFSQFHCNASLKKRSSAANKKS